MYSIPGRTSCRIYIGWYNASPKPTSEFFNARTLTSIVGHAVLLTKGSNERLSSSVVFRHLSVYYSITSTWNYKDSAARGDINNNRACSPHQLSFKVQSSSSKFTQTRMRCHRPRAVLPRKRLMTRWCLHR